MRKCVVTGGARATEDRLLRDLESWIPKVDGDAGSLSRPVRIVVPSRSLRDHLGAALVRRVGRPVAGVAIHTLQGLARDVIERAELGAGHGDDLLDVLVRRHAREEGALLADFEPFHDGYAALTASVADLLDAGLRESDLEPLEDALATAGGSDRIRRAGALVRVAVRTLHSYAELGLGRASSRLEAAAGAVDADPVAALRARAVFVHGFAEATGAATGLLAAVCRHPNAFVFVDRPPDPADPAHVDAGAQFTDRLAERMAFEGLERETDGARADAATLARIEAPGARAEAAQVARRIRALLDRGDRPEGIGIVARALAPYEVPLREELGRVGIPFSSPSATAPPGALHRRIAALLDLLGRRGAVTADRWLDVAADVDPGRLADVRVALHGLGAARLSDVAGLLSADAFDATRDLRLPVRHGLVSRGDPGDSAARQPVEVARGRLPGPALARIVRAAGALDRCLEAWPLVAAAAAHLEALRGVLRELRARDDCVGDAVDELARTLPPHLELAAADVVLLLGRALERRVRAEPFGGEGAGVQVLDATAARGRTFSSLFVIGLNRDVFPRVVLEDALLPDPVRSVLRAILPELSLKETGVVEERYLFAQLLSASASVTLSWQTADEDGKPKAPSPLVERLRWLATEDCRDPLPRSAGPPWVRTAREHALRASLRGGVEAFAPLLPLALAESERWAAGPALAETARARIAVLRELELRSGLGPYFGFVGSIRSELDPRHRDVWVTTLEGTASCPWQTYLQRLLGVEPRPDALSDLPEADRLKIGSTVHRALETLAAGMGGAVRRPLAEVVTLEPKPLVWPDAAAVGRAVHAAADRVRREAGIGLEGFTTVLAALARPAVDAARRIDEEERGRAMLLGAEIDGACEVLDAEGRPRSVRFRADRVDLDGVTLRLTDYKTGSPFSHVATDEAKRERDLLRAVGRGTHLQAAAYAVAAAGANGGGRGVGRYVFLSERTKGDRRFPVDSDPAETTESFRGAVGAALDVFDRGAFFPRLSTPEGDTPDRCEWCEVAEACLRGDSGARRRLQRWAETAPKDAAGAEGALLTVWRLGAEGEA